MIDERWVDRIWQWAFRFGYLLAMGYWALRRPPARGVGVAVWWDHRVLLIDNSYKRHRGLPGGGIHADETRADAAIRELAEEVGIRVAPEAIVLVGTYSGLVDFKHDRITIYELVLKTKPSVQVDHREVVSAGFISVSEAMTQRLNPMIRSYLHDCVSADGPLTTKGATGGR